MQLHVFHNIALDIMAQENRPVRVGELYSLMKRKYPEIKYTKQQLRKYLLDASHYIRDVKHHRLLFIKTHHFSFTYDGLEPYQIARYKTPINKYIQEKLFSESEIDTNNFDWG